MHVGTVCVLLKKGILGFFFLCKGLFSGQDMATSVVAATVVLEGGPLKIPWVLFIYLLYV